MTLISPLAPSQACHFGAWNVRALRHRRFTDTSHYLIPRAAAGLGNMHLYTCTKHSFAWYAWNVLRLTPEDIADRFGHQDGGELVRRTYGHFDSDLSRARVRKAFAAAPDAPIPLCQIAAA